MKNRLPFLDISKGFSIALVILGHIVSNENNIIRIWLYSFHMPIFFIISGFLLNLNKGKNAKNTYRQFIINKFTSLLLPYLSFAIINYFYLMATAWKDNYFTTQLAINYVLYILILCGRSAIWFLPCIFISESVFKFIDRYIPNLILEVILITVIFTIPFFIKAQPDTLLLVLLRSFTAIGFIAIGRFSFNIINKINISAILIVFIFFLNMLFTYYNGAVDLFELKFNNPICYTINSILGSLAIILLSKKINNNRILEYYGKNSLIIMGTHIIFIDVAIRLLVKLFNSSVPVFHFFRYSVIILVVVMLFELLTIHIFNKYLSFLLGKHKNKKQSKVVFIADSL